MIWTVKRFCYIGKLIKEFSQVHIEAFETFWQIGLFIGRRTKGKSK